MVNVMSKKVFIIGTAGEATVTLRGHVADTYGSDVEIVTVDQFNDIKQSVTHIVRCGTAAISLRPQPQLPQIFIDKKRKGWQRPYKYHK